MSTHKDSAEFNIDTLHNFQSEAGATEASMLTVAIEAQANATLYLAEQQRIANLIEWSTRGGHHPSPAMCAQIEMGLGL